MMRILLLESGRCYAVLYNSGPAMYYTTLHYTASLRNLFVVIIVG